MVVVDLYYLPDQQGVISEVHRVLKPGGVLGCGHRALHLDRLRAILQPPYGLTRLGIIAHPRTAVPASRPPTADDQPMMKIMGVDLPVEPSQESCRRTTRSLAGSGRTAAVTDYQEKITVLRARCP